MSLTNFFIGINFSDFIFHFNGWLLHFEGVVANSFVVESDTVLFFNKVINIDHLFFITGADESEADWNNPEHSSQPSDSYRPTSGFSFFLWELSNEVKDGIDHGEQRNKEFNKEHNHFWNLLICSSLTDDWQLFYTKDPSYNNTLHDETEIKGNTARVGIEHVEYIIPGIGHKH